MQIVGVTLWRLVGVRVGVAYLRFTNNFYDLLMFMGGLWVLKWAWQTFF